LCNVKLTYLQEQGGIPVDLRRVVNVVLVAQVLTLVAAAAVLGLIPGLRARVAKADSVRRFSLLAETMRPVDSSIGYDSSDAYLKTTQNSTVSASTTYIGQLDLPDGATVVGVRCLGIDSDPATQFRFRLFRYDLWDDPVWSGVTSFASSGVAFSGGKVMREAAIDPGAAVIDNANFSYGMFVSLPEAQSGELGLLRCVVDTSYTLSMPLLKRD
jgi:hypothetical protein